MTINEQISALTAQRQALLGDHSGQYHDQEKRERLAGITDRIAALYAQKRQEDAARHTTIAERGRR